jgi:phosphatidylglycerol:prolipoprotein diacylglycerol transferase
MLPYLEQPVLAVGPVHLYAFGAIVAVAVIVGVELLDRRARKTQLDPDAARSFALWIIAPGFLGAHVFDALWYHPTEVLAAPGSLLELTAGFSSFGGFLGALGGAFVWRARTRRDLLPFIDVTLSVFPISWAIGRLGCTVAHDHPGVLTTATNPLAFAFPDGPRWDLGFLEMLFSAGLSLVCVVFWRRQRPVGTYVALTALTYAPVRFGLDFLRVAPDVEGDARYGDLTPAQWCCVILFFVGVAAFMDARDARARSARETRARSTSSRLSAR